VADAVHTADEVRDETEDWFVKAGLPHLIVGYTARTDILTRMAPFLIIVFVNELFLATSFDFPWWGNLLAIVGAIALVAAIFVAVNRLRRRRPFQRPDDIGAVEIALFLLVPPLLPLVFGGQARQAILTFAANVGLLALSYVFTSYALLPTLMWGIRQLLVQFRTIGNVLARSLPLLLLFTMFMFLNAELWKVVDDLPRGFMIVALLILVGAGSVFVLLRLPTEIGDSSMFDSWDAVESRLDGTPVEHLAIDQATSPPSVPLSRRARVNVGVVIFFGQAVQIVAVTLAIWFFYVFFGMFTIIGTTVEQWTGSPDMRIWFSFDFFGSEVAVTSELVRTSLFIAAIAGLQFAVAALTDPTYRDESTKQVTDNIRRVFAVREVYLARLVPRTAE
jgi:hypothetical protein